MKISIKKVVSAWAAMTVALVMFSISSVLAQSEDRNGGASNPGYSISPRSANPQTIDDATLKRAARAFAKIGEIARTEQSVLNGSGDDRTKERAAQEAEAQKVAVVRAEGMQPQQYNQVLQIVQADNDLEQKFLLYVNDPKNSSQNTM